MSVFYKMPPAINALNARVLANEGGDESILAIDPVSSCKAPATCGEFIQGFIDDKAFLVNCPIDRYSQATVTYTDKPGLNVRSPQQYYKIGRALSLMESELGLPQGKGFEVSIESDIPRGKGMASSSADLAAAIFAMSVALGEPMNGGSMSQLIAQIEPSDSVHLPGISEINHLNGGHIVSLPAPTNLSVLVVDCGGAIDTVDIDREEARAYYKRKQSSIVSALSLMNYGLQRGNLWAITEAATISARLSQALLPKPIFYDLLSTVKEAGALGLNCAHSGTVLGVLYRTSDRLADKLTQLIETRFGDDGQVLANHRIISGGCHA